MFDTSVTLPQLWQWKVLILRPPWLAEFVLDLRNVSTSRDWRLRKGRKIRLCIGTNYQRDS